MVKETHNMKKLIILLSILILTSCNEQSDYKELINSAKEMTDNGKYSEAIGLLDDVIKLKPDFDSAYVERAYNYLQINKPEVALEDANKAIEIKYDNISAYFIRGVIYGYKYEFDKALKDYTHIIRLGDSIYMNVALRERAYIYYNTNEIDKAISDYSDIIGSDSLSYESYVSRGIAKLRIDVYQKYSDSIKIALNDTALYKDILKYFKIAYSGNNYSSIMYDTRGAILDFNEALMINPNYDFAYFNRAKVFEELNLFDNALADINRAIELNNKSDYYMTRALIYKSLKITEKSLNDFNKAIELNPKNGFAYINRGYLKREQLNDKKGAEKDIKMAGKLGVETDE